MNGMKYTAKRFSVPGGNGGPAEDCELRGHTVGGTATRFPKCQRCGVRMVKLETTGEWVALPGPMSGAGSLQALGELTTTVVRK